MSVTRDTSHVPIGPCGPMEQSADSLRHASTAFFSSCRVLGENSSPDVAAVVKVVVGVVLATVPATGRGDTTSIFNIKKPQIITILSPPLAHARVRAHTHTRARARTHIGREGEREGGREGENERGRERERERDGERWREMERDRERQRERQSDGERQRETERDTERQR